MSKKCIVLDLDNTLWGGILGEDGLEGIRLGPTPEGRPYLEFQKYLLSLFNRGIILAINSKNNHKDALRVFQEHPNMVLKEHNFASMQINWNDKVSNLKNIAKELNIGLDSLVFIDDEKLNREMVKSILPEVEVVDLPEDPSLYLKTLAEIDDFNILKITEEDKKRGKMYAERRKRQELQNKSSTDITQFLKDLRMIATINMADSFNIPRIAQLTQKTNQFNMTTRRYSEEDIKKFSGNKNFLVMCISIKDKFGDNGITGAAIVEKSHESWRIDTFLLSCRIIGRKAEEILLGHIIGLAKNENVKKIIGEFIPTQKNTPAKSFYKNSKFFNAGKSNNMEKWELKNLSSFKYPDFIKITR